MAEPTGAVTALIAATRHGDPKATAEFVELVYRELKALARHYMDNERSDHTLQTTALVNEAYLRLFAKESPSWENRAHFLAHAALAMRQILVDHARGHLAKKRGGKLVTISLDEVVAASEETEDRQAKAVEPRNEESTRRALLAEDLVDLDLAFDELAVLDARHSKIVQLRYLGGLTVEQIAAFVGISAATVQRDLRVAVPWLRRRLKHGSR